METKIWKCLLKKKHQCPVCYTLLGILGPRCSSKYLYRHALLLGINGVEISDIY